MDYIPNDDDDLFEYDPEESSTSYDHTQTSSSSSNNSINSDYVDAVKNTLRNTSIDSEDSGVNRAQVRLSTAFYEGTYHWVNNESSANGFLQSVIYVLDKITNNDFSKIQLFKETEFRLAKKLFVDYLMREAFAIDDNQKYDDGIQSIMKEMFDVDISDFYMNVCYTIIYDMNRHSIHLDRIIYTALSAQLELPTKEILFVDDPDLNDLYRSFNYSLEHKDKVTQILSEIITPDVLKMVPSHDIPRPNYKTQTEA
jgi:hypothetical protein